MKRVFWYFYDTAQGAVGVEKGTANMANVGAGVLGFDRHIIQGALLHYVLELRLLEVQAVVVAVLARRICHTHQQHRAAVWCALYEMRTSRSSRVVVQAEVNDTRVWYVSQYELELVFDVGDVFGTEVKNALQHGLGRE